MAKALSAKVEGMPALKSGFKKYLKDIEKVSDATLTKAGQATAADARARCVIPSIAQTIRFQKIDKQYIITTQGEHSAYLEFGTGNYAKVLLGPYPQDWKDMAMRFFINGLGRTPAKPYLYPAFQQHAGEAVLEIADRIEGL